MSYATALSQYGYNSTDTQSAPIWFSAQSVLVQASVINTVCSATEYQSISEFFESLNANINVGSYIRDLMSLCTNAAMLSANSTTQQYAIKKICSDWSVAWPSNVMRTYALLAIRAPSPLEQSVFDVMNKCPVIDGYLTPGNKWNRRTVLSPFNQAIADMYSVYGMNGEVWSTTNVKRNILFACSQVFQSIWAIAYLFFSCPVPLTILQILRPTAGYSDFNFWFQMASSATLIVLDIIFVSSFTRYILRTQLSISVEPLFLIVSQFGIATALPCIGIGVLSINLITTAITSDYSILALYLTMWEYNRASNDQQQYPSGRHTMFESNPKEKLDSYEEERYSFVSRYVHC
ncbi:hypothetical protein BDR26DRAFT_864991 [Obelidium mucronatum]|nr:hypothetical protein BDR26DRAFT_864991 [Obelidium mucronatum]